MNTANGYMVKMTYNAVRLFEEPVPEAPRPKEMIEVQAKITLHLSRQEILKKEEFSRLKTVVSEGQAAQALNQNRQLIEAIK